jgi:two-component system NtrC family sensor kinase
MTTADAPAGLDPDYIAALAAHLGEESETSLSQAYELGRKALGQGLGLLDILGLYQAVQKELLLSAAPADQPRIAAAIGDFFRELISPYEMSFRGYREANTELGRLNQELSTAYAELQTQQMQLIQAAKMASLGELVAGIAHEINNPLAFILSHLGTVDSSLTKVAAALPLPLPPVVRENIQKAQDRLDECQSGAGRIRDLVLKLRTFSRLDEGQRKSVSITECVTSVLKILEHRCKEHIVVQTSFGYPDVVECFPSLLNQAIMNLIANAIDAIDGSGQISVMTGADGNDYVIAVADTGKGIPEALRARVLEPFFTTKPVGVGTGLGLSITYSIVQTHGGTLDLSPRSGGGTVATIRFPLPARPSSSVPAK